MAILRNLVNNKFTIIQNELITDTRISANAFRVACYLLSRPDGWQVYNKDIQDKLGIKTGQALANYWKELISVGIVHRRQVRGSGNRFSGGFEYAVGGIPEGWDVADSGQTAIGENDCENDFDPLCGKTVLRKTHTLNKTEHSNTENRKVESITGVFLQTPHDVNQTPESIANHIPAQRPEERLQDTKGKRLNMATVAKNGYPLAAEALQILGTLQAVTPSRIALTVTADHLPTIEANLKAAIAFNGVTLAEYMAMSVRRATAKKWLNLSMVSGIGLVTAKGDPMTPDDFASFVAKIMA